MIQLRSMLQNNDIMTRYILSIISILIISGCAATAQPKTIQIDILKFKFIPAEITINKGDTIVWVNQEKRQYHSVWFEESGAPEPDYFFPGETFTQKFNDAGDFPYRCGPHPEMLGKVTVK